MLFVFILIIFFLFSIDITKPVWVNVIANTTLNSTELSVNSTDPSVNLTLPNASDNACPVTYTISSVEVDVHIVNSCSITFTICWQNADVYICTQVFHIGHHKVTITVTDEPGNSAPCDFYIWIIGEYLGKDK